mmetsp:Transcript_129948/g.290053  ORF Transcript_129948/g.290053 Transcript_129948/m.290053 type:complete len:219 (-) Transcript_129948:3-659(-)
MPLEAICHVASSGRNTSLRSLHGVKLECELRYHDGQVVAIVILTPAVARGIAQIDILEDLAACARDLAGPHWIPLARLHPPAIEDRNEGFLATHIFIVIAKGAFLGCLDRQLPRRYHHAHRGGLFGPLPLNEQVRRALAVWDLELLLRIEGDPLPDVSAARLLRIDCPVGGFGKDDLRNVLELRLHKQSDERHRPGAWPSPLGAGRRKTVGSGTLSAA